MNREIVATLCGKLCNETLTPAEAARLEAILREDEELCDLYIQWMHLHNSLDYKINGEEYVQDVDGPERLSVALARAVAGVGDVADQANIDRFGAGQDEPCGVFGSGGAYSDGALERLTESSRPIRWRGRRISRMFSRDNVLASTAALVAVTCVAMWTAMSFGPAESSRDLTSHEFPPKLSAGPAQVVWLSLDCQFTETVSRVDEGDYLLDGQEIRIQRGEAKLHFKHGARITLWGPSRFVVKSSNAGVLVAGSLTAEVTDDSRGFSVDVPNGKVVDLGTKFGVVVDDFGVSKVGVFDGEVITYMGPQSGGGGRRESLAVGEGLQWDSKASKRFLLTDHSVVRNDDDTFDCVLDREQVRGMLPVL
ncbi:FecR family protein, partial [Pirellulales bacterium]|nr:FecR family protein [Pirellulales bacterium]